MAEIMKADDRHSGGFGRPDEGAVTRSGWMGSLAAFGKHQVALAELLAPALHLLRPSLLEFRQTLAVAGSSATCRLPLLVLGVDSKG